MGLGKRLFTTTAIVILAVATLGAGSSERFERLGHAMMCTCGCNQVLLECNHVGCPSSDKMRNELSAAMDSGSSDSGVLDRFVEKYGPPVLAAPLTTGFGRVAWIMPFAVLALALSGCIFLINRWRSRSGMQSALAATPADNDRAEALRMRARQETEL